MASPRFAPIEDLDPEPAVPRGGLHRREWILGLLLLLLVGGFAGGQWWVQQTGLAHYQAGTAAAARYDWAAAARAFAAAGSYADASGRAGDATAKAAERDQQYARGVSAAGRHDWPAALAALQQVQAIAPGYQDTPALLEQAEAQVYPQALGDTVVLRTGAEAPGLYSWSVDSWRRFPGSDAGSGVVAACPGGGAVYDGPAADAPPGGAVPPPADARGTGRRGRFTGRQLLAWAPGRAAPRVLAALDPTKFDRYVCTATGVWGLTAGRDAALPAATPALVPAGLTAARFAAFDQPGLSTPALLGAGWTLLDLAPDGAHLLAAQVLGGTPETVQLHLALVDRAGRFEPLVQVGPGPLLAAHFSPDSRYLVLTFLGIGDTDQGTRSTLLLDTQSGRLAVLAQVALDWRAGVDPLAGADPFLLHGPRANAIVVTTQEAGHEVVHLIDPAHPAAPLATVIVDNGSPGLRFANSAPDAADLLLAWRDPGRAAGGPSGFLALLDPAGGVTLAQPAIAPAADLWYAWLRGPDLVYETRVSPDARAGAGFALATQRRADLAGPAPAPTAIYTGTLTAREMAGGPLGADVYLGAGLLAYAAPNGELHARTYDGTVDLLLDRHVGALYPLHPGDSP